VRIPLPQSRHLRREHQSWHGQKSAADSEVPGNSACRQPRKDEPGSQTNCGLQIQLRFGVIAIAAAPQRESSNDDHERDKQCQQSLAVGRLSQSRSRPRSNHARGCEEQRTSPLHVSLPSMQDQVDRSADRHRHGAGSDCQMRRAHADEIDQQGSCQDRSASTDQSEDNGSGRRRGTASAAPSNEQSSGSGSSGTNGVTCQIHDGGLVIDHPNAAPGVAPSFLRIIARGQRPVKAA